MTMIDENILREKAKSYIVCFNNECPLHEHCLRWQVGCHVPNGRYSVLCFNPHHIHYEGDTCPGYRSDQPQRIPRGMVNFYTAMTGQMEKKIRNKLIDCFSKVVYFRYRRGEKPITPDVEQIILNVCRECGWNEPLVFDSYSDELVW